MANNKDFIVKNGLVVLAQGSSQSTSTTTGAIVTPGGIGVGGNANIAGGINVSGVDLLAYDDHIIYVSDETGNDTTGDGRRTQSAYKTIKYALSQAVAGDKVYVEPGTYIEQFPLTVPQGVSLIGAGLRAVTIQPTVGTNTSDCFYLNGESYISDLTITGFFKPGWAFKFDNGAKITTRSPYIERISVITRGSSPTSEDPYGYLSGDAGNGAYLDAGVLDPTSLEPAMLWNEVTMIVPNATGWYMTNGARAELLNGFSYFADKAIQAVAGPTGYGGVGRTKLRLANITGVFTASDTLYYYSNTGTLLASYVIDEVVDDYLYFNGPAYGFRTDEQANTSTQIIFSTGTWAATATSITLADYHQFGAELRCIGSAAVFGNQGVLADGTGTNLKLIAFNMSHIGAGGDLSNDDSLVVPANEIIQTNGGTIFYQTVDQGGNFRVGDSFLVNQRTGDVSFGNAVVNLTTLTSLTITNGINSTVLEPTSISVGNLLLSGTQLASASGNLTLNSAGPAIILNDDTRVQGSLTVTNTLRLTNTVNAISSTTGALQIDGGVSVDKDIWLGGSINVNGSATIVDLYVTGNAVIPGGFTATSFTSTELTVVGPAALQQLTATLSTLTELTVTGNSLVEGNFVVSGTTLLTVVTGTNATFSTLTVTSNTNSNSTVTGALIVTGGAGIGRNLYVGGDTYLQGNLYVDGASFTVDSTNIVTADRVLNLASATTLAALANNSGIVIGTGSGFVSFLFDGSSSWKSRGSIVPNGTANLGGLTNPWNTVYGNSIFDNQNRVVTSVTPTTGLGIGIINLASSGPAVTFQLTNTGVLSVLAGTDTQVVSATGNVQINVTATLQSVTARGSTTTQAIYINNSTGAANTFSGALRVEGGVGIGGRLYVRETIFSNGAQVWTTATLTDNSQLTNGAGYLTSSTLGIFGVSAINAGPGIAVSSNTGSVTVTNIGVVSLQGSAYIAVSTSTGSVQVVNLGVQTLTAGTDTAVSRSTGTVTVWNIATLQSVTARGNTTNQQLAITATNLSASTSSGQALLVSGGIGALALYATNVFDSGNRVLTSVSPVAGTAISVTSISTSGANTTFTINNTGVTTATGTAYLGVSGSNGNVTFTNLGVQTLTAGTDTAVSASTGTVTVWSTSTLQSITNRGSTTNNAINISNNTNATSTNSGALTVAGGVGVNRDLFVGGALTVVGTLNAATVVGAISTATNLLGGATGSIPYQTVSGQTAFIGIGANGTLLQSNGSTATWNSTLTIHVGSAQGAVTATNVFGGSINATTAVLTGITSVTNTTPSVSTVTGALTVAGGVGIRGSLYANEIYDNNNRVVTSITPSAGTAIGISNLVSSGPLASFAITNLGVQGAVGTDYLGVSSTTGTVTFTNLGVQTISGSSFLGVSAATGTVTLTNLGVQTLTAGTDTAVSASTGTVTVWTTSTLQSITNRGATTNQPINITNATGSSTSTQGALVVSGGVGIGQNLNVAGNLNVFGRAVFSDQTVFQGTATFVLSTNTVYTDNVLQLHSVATSTDQAWVIDDGKDIGLKFNYYNRTWFTGVSAALILDNDSQWLEWYSSATEVGSIFTAGTYGSFRTGAIQLTNTTNASSTTTGALTVVGGAGIGGNLYAGGAIFAQGSQVITAATLGAFGVSQIIPGPAISVSPASGTGTVTIGNLGVRSISTGSGISVSTSTGSVIIQSIDTLQDVTNRNPNTTNAIRITNNTAATGSTTGSIVVSGGIGVGGGLFVNGTSTFVGQITGVITTANNILGGTAGALLYQAASGQTQFIGIGGEGNVLTSNGSTPVYVTTSSLVVGAAIFATTATNLAAGSQGAIPYQSSFGQTAFVGGSGSQGNVLVSRGTSAPAFQNTLTLAGTTNATSTLTGAFVTLGGAGIGQDLWVGGTGYFSGSPVVTAANLGQFGVAQIVPGTGIAVNTGTGTVVVTNIGVTSLTTTTTGGIAISTSTGSVTIQSIDTLQLVTQRGPTTNQPISITATILSSSTSTGQSLIVRGGVGALAVYASNLFDNSLRVITNVVPTAGSGISITSVSTSNATMAFTINNTGVLSVAGTTFIGVSASSGNVTFTNLGVQSLTAGTGTAVSASTGQVTISSIDTLQLVTNRGFTTTNRIEIANSTQSTGTTTGALTVIGGIGVQGDIYARNIYTNGQIVGGQTSTSTNLAGGNTGDIVYQSSPGVTGFIGVGTTGTILVSNGTTATFQPASSVVSGLSVTATNIAGGLAGWIPIQNSVGRTSFITSGTVGQLLQMGTNTATWISTSSLYVNNAVFANTATSVAGGVAGQLLYQSAGGVTNFAPLGAAGQLLVSGGSGAPVYQSTLTLAGTTQATSTNTGALQVVGGVGIGGNLWVGGTLYASIDGSISTATNIAGGGLGAIPYQTAIGTTRFIGIGVNGSILQSNGTTATWVSTSTLLVGSALASTNANNISGGSAGALLYQNGVGQTAFVGIGAVGTILRSNGSTATFVSTATLLVGESFRATTSTHIDGGTTGAIPYQTTIGRTAFIGIGPAGSILQSNGTTASWFSTGSLLTGVSQNLNAGTPGSIPYQESTGTTKFIAPGPVGSILVIGASNTATFVNSSSVYVGNALFANSSTFAQDLAGQVAGGGELVYQFANNDTRFLGTGTAGTILVSRPGAPVWSNTLTLAGTTPATSTGTGALVVAGGVGIAGDLYVGGNIVGTVNANATTSSNLSAGTLGDIPYQIGSGQTRFIGIGANGTILRSNGTTATWATTASLVVGYALSAGGVGNLSGGTAGAIPYQISPGVTGFIGIGPTGFLLQSNGSTATWVTTGSLVAGIALEAINIRGGAANQVPYQAGTSSTTFSSNFTFNGTALTVAGAVNGGQFIPSSASVPSRGLYGDSGVGIATNSTTRMFFDTAGNVGVATASPTATLDVNGGLRVTGVFTSTNATAATAANNGALIVSGGIGIGGNSFFGGIISITNTTAATNTSTGALRVSGGASVQGDLWARTVYADSIDVAANAVVMATAFS